MISRLATRSRPGTRRADSTAPASSHRPARPAGNPDTHDRAAAGDSTSRSLTSASRIFDAAGRRLSWTELDYPRADLGARPLVGRVPATCPTRSRPACQRQPTPSVRKSGMLLDILRPETPKSRPAVRRSIVTACTGADERRRHACTGTGDTSSSTSGGRPVDVCRISEPPIPGIAGRTDPGGGSAVHSRRQRAVQPSTCPGRRATRPRTDRHRSRRGWAARPAPTRALRRFGWRQSRTESVLYRVLRGPGQRRALPRHRGLSPTLALPGVPAG